MINAFKTVRSQPSSAAVFASPIPSRFGRKATAVRFAATTATNQQHADKRKMEKTENPNEKTGDVMSHSFGEGYATRSEEEGFGGIYGGNQSIQKDKEIHENHPAYDKTQGSEVSEKEKARNQKHASN
ncbi:PREDICTED: uncharacterized protein LOC104821276 [Tarenaya hassleriana]|uniref:uncharacterized protein LOC104821276 n=1 Tax=Tarenaya hassleriana TaxID=28532 RepID=UPI00053C6C85|nr:PREDICTED: uncharacterized protein LOC104821276 [Tarenaya hassleriana]